MRRLIIQNATDDYSRFQVEAEGRGIVARVEVLEDEPFGLELARLIAAAPAMLAALEALTSGNPINVAGECRFCGSKYFHLQTVCSHDDCPHTMGCAAIAGEHQTLTPCESGESCAVVDYPGWVEDNE